jgi:hypothetical protein
MRPLVSDTAIAFRLDFGPETVSDTALNAGPRDSSRAVSDTVELRNRLTAPIAVSDTSA